MIKPKSVSLYPRLRYEVKLPFNAVYDFLPDNFNVAKNRLFNLKQKLLKNENLARTYDKIFNEYLKNGIIEKFDHTNKVSENDHYLPHRPVIKNETDTTKTRIVFDASSKSNNEICINDALYSWPCLLPLLYNILLRFRVRKTGIVADIKQAFLQIFVDYKDRDLIRFLWFENINDPGSKIVIYHFTRVVFGLTSSPYLLNVTLQHHLSNYLSMADISFYIEKLMRDLYVDDSTNSFDEVHECQRFFEISKACLAAAYFNLRKWATNNSDLRNVINNASHTDEKQGKSEHENIRKVLGLNWDLDNDTFIFEFNEILQTARSLPITKRNILKLGECFLTHLVYLAL